MLESRWTLGLASLVMLAAGCASTADESGAVPDVVDPAIEPQGADALDADRGSAAQRENGRKLFERETFRGNGRTCASCHPGGTNGTVSPADARRRFAKDRRDPLFRSIDSDDGVGSSYTRLLTDATIRVTVPLPANWSLADDPSARSVTFRRAIPTTLNVPALDTVFMADGQFTTLEAQAQGAVNAHYQAGRKPTFPELGAIADFQKTNEFFSSKELRRYARGGPPPVLPQGRTPSEKRGRNWLVPSASGVCGHCHAGPMLNTTSEFLIGGAPGLRFFTAFVSELNKAGAPVRNFVVRNADGTTTTIASPDPGRALVTGNPADANFFRIPTIWGAKDTAPYFHDNSARTLEDLSQHYSDYFQIVGLPALTVQEQADINAYVKLL